MLRELRLASQVRSPKGEGPLSEKDARCGARAAAGTASVFVRSPVADVAQLAERVLGKDEVTSSILVIGSSSTRLAVANAPDPAFAKAGGREDQAHGERKI